MRLLGIVMFALLFLSGVVLLRWAGSPAQADSESGESMSIYMEHFQHKAHKLGLALDAQNKDLAAFYIEELGELVTYCLLYTSDAADE